MHIYSLSSLVPLSQGEGGIIQNMTIIDEIVLDTPLNIDDKCDVKWRAGDKTLRAVIIERRPKNCRKRRAANKKDTSMPPVDNLKADEVEYYVHYVDHDR